MTADNASPQKQPPEIHPYVFTVLLLLLGLWCFYDGWLTTNPEMMKHATFNRVASGVLIPWALIDYYRQRRRARAQGRPPRAEKVVGEGDDKPAADGS